MEIASRKERGEQYNGKTDRSRAWQTARTAKHYPAAYSLLYPEGELSSGIAVPLMSTCQWRALFKDPFTVVPPTQLPATPATPKKQWLFKEFTVVCPNSKVIGRTSISPPAHHITVCTISLNGMDNDKMRSYYNI